MILKSSIFLAVIAAFALSLGWLSWRMIDMEKESYYDQSQASFLQKTRLALWLLEGRALAILNDASYNPNSSYRVQSSNELSESIEAQKRIGSSKKKLEDIAPVFEELRQISKELPKKLRKNAKDNAIKPSSKSWGVEQSKGSDYARRVENLYDTQNATLSFQQSRARQQEASGSIWVPKFNEQGELQLEQATQKPSSKTRIQLNQKLIEATLQKEIKDLFPSLSFSTIQDHTRFRENALIALPLEAVFPYPATQYELSPEIRVSLIGVWSAFFVAVIVMVVLIYGLWKLSERRSQFVASVTHELRTPLTSFQLYAEMLRDDLIPSAEKRKSYLETLTSEAQRLSHLVENVLSYSRIERGSAQVVREKLDINDFLLKAQFRLEEHVNKNEGQLTIINKIPQGTRAETDPTAIEQILFNLIDNACKYAFEKGKTNEVILSTSIQKKKLYFEVQDFGPGISKKEVKKLFKPFHKTAEQAASTKPGVGLGLSIAKRQAKLLGGTLKIKNHKEGTQFELVCKGL